MTIVKKTSNAKKNRMLEEDTPLHHWYQFVLCYPPHLVRHYLKKFNVGTNNIVLDPFCGTGTTPIECLKNGIESYGVESNPIACLASQVKTTTNLDPNELTNYLAYIIKSATISFDNLGIPDKYTLLYELKTNKKLVQINSIPQINEDKQKIIPTDFISKKPLSKILVMKEIVNEIDDNRIRDFFIISMANLIVKKAGNISFGPEIGRTEPKIDIDALNYFFSHTHRMIQDVIRYNSLDAKATIIKGDSRYLDEYLPRNVLGKIDCVITSPPYPNEKDYTRSTRLESVLLDFLNNKEDLRRLKSNLLRSNSRNIFVTDNDGDQIKDFERINKIADEIERKRIALNKSSGFEKMYHKIVRHYFGGMYLHLKSLKPFLSQKAKLVYIVGDQMSFFRTCIPTAELLSEIAESLGYRELAIELWRTRLATVTKMQLNENALILENV